MTIPQLQQFLMWCSIINIGLLIFSSLMIMAMQGFICRFHGRLFRLPEESVSKALYLLIGLWKISIFLFNIVPWLALYLID